jgi:non-heme chloroperoxidase
MTAAAPVGPSQVGDGHDMDHYADDLAALTRISIPKMLSMSATQPVAARLCIPSLAMGEGRVSKAAIISAVPPLMVQTPANPNGLPKKVFDDFQAALAANHSQFYRDVAASSFYNYNKTGNY